jgi:hypothetical protein
LNWEQPREGTILDGGLWMLDGNSRALRANDEFGMSNSLLKGTRGPAVLLAARPSDLQADF